MDTESRKKALRYFFDKVIRPLGFTNWSRPSCPMRNEATCQRTGMSCARGREHVTGTNA